MNALAMLTTATSPVRSRVAKQRKAFTLVELLVVIVIIGILVGLLVPTIGGALARAKNAQMGLEVSNLAKSIEAYRMEIGDYPPDFAMRQATQNATQVSQHLARKFRYRKPADQALFNDDMAFLDPAEALVFWLSGFGADEKFPLSKRENIGTGKPIKGDKPFFDFDQARLDDRDGDGYPEYYPQTSQLPFVYLKHNNYGAGTDRGVFAAASHAILVSPSAPSGVTQVRAYAAELQGMAVKRFAESEKYQILCAGQDGDFGAGATLGAGLAPMYPDGVGYAEADEDNLTNFSEGKTLEAAIP